MPGTYQSQNKVFSITWYCWKSAASENKDFTLCLQFKITSLRKKFELTQYECCKGSYL